MITEQVLHQFCQILEQSHQVAALTGAGISTHSGIPDFRGPHGLYATKKYDPEKLFDIQYFLKDPKPFYDFVRDFVDLEHGIKPTLTHEVLSDLEQKGKLAAVATQNIDGLHQRAGSKTVYELHGSFEKSYCMKCAQAFPYEQMKEKIVEQVVPFCSCGGLIKPDIVFFREPVKYLDEAVQAAADADLFLVIGTSCAVYPAAMIPMFASKVIVINGAEVSIPGVHSVLSIQSDIDEFFSEVKNLLKGFQEKDGTDYHKTF